MKKFLLAAFVASVTASAHGQIVTETVNFDSYNSQTDNDLANRFLFGSSTAPGVINQFPINGITGGSLFPSDEPNYANDIIQYCSTYQNVRGAMATSSICFKFNSSLRNVNSSARPIVLNLAGAPVGEGLRFEVNQYNRTNNPFTIGITAYNYAGSSILTSTLITGHWYKLVAQYQSIGGTFNDQIAVRAELFDIGTTGLLTPASVGFQAATIFRAPLVAATSYTVSLMGARWGGAELLDNFSFSGSRAGSICTALATKPSVAVGLHISPNPAKGEFSVVFDNSFAGQVYQIQVLDMMGKAVSILPQLNASKKQFVFDVSSVASGMYVVNVQTSVGRHSQKLIVE